MVADTDELAREVEEKSRRIRQVLEAVQGVVVGQTAMIERLLMGLLTGGHVLLEGVPGLAKTLTVSSLAQALGCPSQRIQFTPDLLPADILGTLVFNPKDGDFTIKKGPIFSQIILADEINRAPAKVQSALLEVMQEKQVTIGETSFLLDEPFLVLATQNPIDQEGTYALPEAQVDRFMFKLKVGYPSKDEERLILDRMASTRPTLAIEPVVGPEQILEARGVVDRIHIEASVRDYIVDLVQATRKPSAVGAQLDDYIEHGASPRATIALTMGARATAFLAGRPYVTPQDVKDTALDVLRHRLILSYEAEADRRSSDDLIVELLRRVPLP